MNGKKVVSFLALLLCACLLWGCTGKRNGQPERETHIDTASGFSPAAKLSEFTEISKNEQFTLYANLKTGEAKIEDRKSGKVWWTNPENKFDDTLASGFYKNALLSVITVVYTTAQSVEMTCGGYLSSVSKDGMYYRIEPDGSIVFLFDFLNEQFRVPIRYAITDEGFSASILTDGILEYGSNKIKSIDLLPFFGAGGSDEDGYLFVPDGSGALIRFNNERLTARTYTQSLYGFDNGTNDRTMGGAAIAGYFTLSQNAYLPVFGLNCGDNGFVAVMQEGAPRASVNANTANKYTTYNTVWTTYAYRTIGTVRQTQKDGSDQVVSIGEKNLETYRDYTVAYCFLDAGHATYADMAARYRSYLIAHEGLEARVANAERIPLYLDVYGHIEKTKSLLGVPMEKKITTASIRDVNAMLDTLAAEGADRVIVKYNHWAKNSFYRKIPTHADVESKVGTAEQMLALQERLKSAGGELYLGADLMNVYQSGRGVNPYRDALQSVANTVQRQYAFRLDSAMIDTRYNPWYLLRLDSIERVFGEYAENMNKAGYTGAALDTVGEKLYSELGTNGTGRNRALEVVRDATRSVRDTVGSLMLTGANEYAANCASHILVTPAKSSGFDLEDESVPFYQMVYHGYVSYSLRASNLSSNPVDLTLTCIEYGANPLYSLICENVDELIGSRQNRIYSADFENWHAYAAAQYRQLNEVLAPVQTARIVSHTIIEEAVRCVAYENGVNVWVNYGTAPYLADGIEVPAKGFAATHNGRVYASAQALGD